MDIGTSREGCLTRALRRTSERTESEEKGERATELQGKGAQKKIKRKGDSTRGNRAPR